MTIIAVNSTVFHTYLFNVLLEVRPQRFIDTVDQPFVPALFTASWWGYQQKRAPLLSPPPKSTI